MYLPNVFQTYQNMSDTWFVSNLVDLRVHNKNIEGT